MKFQKFLDYNYAILLIINHLLFHMILFAVVNVAMQ